MGKSILVYEGGESLRFDELAISEAVKGTERVMAYLGMKKSGPKPKKSMLLRNSTWVRAEVSGLFRLIKVSGQSVSKGEVIGHISGPTTLYEVPVESPVDGYIIGHNNIPVIHKGDALFHIGTL